MNAIIPAGVPFYPESDGKPMSDNTKQFNWIVMLATNLRSVFVDREDVFVSGNQFWYPVEGEPTINASPDVYVVFGRPKGDRRSYKQWEEDNIPMTVVFEVLSPANTTEEMAKKFDFYDEHGVEEYYVYDPESNALTGYRRGEATLAGIHPIADYVSPRLGVRFDMSGEELVVRYPDGRPFIEFEQLMLEREQADARADQATQRADQATQQADQATQRADHEAQRADREAQRAASAERLNERFAFLSQRMLDSNATPEEQDELRQLLEERNRP